MESLLLTSRRPQQFWDLSPTKSSCWEECSNSVFETWELKNLLGQVCSCHLFVTGSVRVLCSVFTLWELSLLSLLSALSGAFLGKKKSKRKEKTKTNPKVTSGISRDFEVHGVNTCLYQQVLYRSRNRTHMSILWVIRCLKWLPGAQNG